MPDTHIGQPRSRVDGPAKVTGTADYAADGVIAGLLHGAVVSSGIARGAITRIHTAAAEAVPGVVAVITHENRPRTAWLSRSYQDQVAPPGTPFRAFYDETVQFSGQQCDRLTWEGAATAGEVPVDVVALWTDSRMGDTVAKLYIGHDDLLLRRVVIETTPAVGPTTPGKIGDALDELAPDDPNAAPAPIDELGAAPPLLDAPLPPAPLAAQSPRKRGLPTIISSIPIPHSNSIRSLLSFPLTPCASAWTPPASVMSRNRWI